MGECLDSFYIAEERKFRSGLGFLYTLIGVCAVVAGIMGGYSDRVSDFGRRLLNGASTFLVEPFTESPEKYSGPNRPIFEYREWDSRRGMMKVRNIGDIHGDGRFECLNQFLDVRRGDERDRSYNFLGELPSGFRQNPKGTE